MEVSSLGTSLERAEALLHEQVHSFLTPSPSSVFGTMGATDVRLALYQNSQLFRYGEEALAETTAQMGTRSLSGFSFTEALQSGMQFPFSSSLYQPMSVWGLTGEAAGLAGGAALFGGGLYAASSFDETYGLSLQVSDPVGKFYKHR